MKKEFRFNFKIKYVEDLRRAVNDKVDISVKKIASYKSKYDKKSEFDYNAWDRICAAIDRLEDTLHYLNSLVLVPESRKRAAFDFYNFINCEYIVIECIKILAIIYELDIEELKKIDNTQKIFGNVLEADGNDGDFFEYVRSLCSVHPVNTNRKKNYLKGSKIHCCPYVVWNIGIASLLLNENADLYAKIYTSIDEDEIIHLPLRVKDFVNYMNRWIDLIPKITETIYLYNNNVYEKFRNTPLKTKFDFNNIVDYLLYLKNEDEVRFGGYRKVDFEKCIRIFSIELSNNKNNEKLQLLKNAIIYSLDFVHNSLINMSTEGFENTGLSNDDSFSTELISTILWPHSYDSIFNEYTYNLEKVEYLENANNYSVESIFYARALVEEINPLINQYVLFLNNESDEEVYILVSLALYLEALNNVSILNDNIPNSLDYREKLK